MNTLLAWPMSCRSPNRSTGSNGEPVATRARPSVQSRTSAGVASATDVGFESGMTTGRGVASAIARTTASVNVPATPVVPTRICGRTRRTVSSRSGVATVHGRRGRASLLGRVEVLATGMDQPARVHGHDRVAR